AGGRVIRSEELRVNGPQITALNPDHGLPNTQVVISGRNFGPDQGRSNVTFAGEGAKVESWSDSEIVALVPEKIRTGLVIVTVEGIPSNGVSFRLDGEPTEVIVATPDSGSPRLCFAAEPYEPPGPWLIPSMNGPGIGWACIVEDQLFAGDVLVHTSCAPPDDVKIFPSLVADFDGVNTIRDHSGSITGIYTPDGIILTIRYDETPGICPGGEDTVMFRY
uniref:IPT/TIG domain-containing protein n=1 Tax=Candidatus Oscillochloris fontis TaxID=2496868 RepID=UPI0015831FE2